METFDDDIALVVCICGDTVYEICTTHNRHNLYLFESEASSDETDETVKYETVNATNISQEVDEIKTYADLVELVLSYTK